MAHPTQDLETRFRKHYVQSEGCWEWQSSVHRNGYGKFNIGGKTMLAHRIAWELAFGNIPDGRYVLHHCDNPRCVRPDHLFLGDDKANVDDMWLKGRGKSGKGTPRLGSRGDRHWKRRMPERVKRGEACSWSKLSEDDVRAIRARYAAGEITQRELADEFNVHVMVINSIILRRSWKHIP